MFVIQPMIVLLLARDLHVGGTLMGLLLAGSGVGGAVGGLVAHRFANRFGEGYGMVLACVLTAPTSLLIPLAEQGWRLALVGGALCAIGFGAVVYNVLQISLRQTLAPPTMLGRVNATMRTVSWGTAPAGGFVGGLLAVAVGVRGALLVGAIGLSLASVWLLARPILRSGVLVRTPTGTDDREELDDQPTEPRGHLRPHADDVRHAQSHRDP
jgi:MFS family permease